MCVVPPHPHLRHVSEIIFPSAFERLICTWHIEKERERERGIKSARENLDIRFLLSHWFYSPLSLSFHTIFVSKERETETVPLVRYLIDGFYTEDARNVTHSHSVCCFPPSLSNLVFGSRIERRKENRIMFMVHSCLNSCSHESNSPNN